MECGDHTKYLTEKEPSMKNSTARKLSQIPPGYLIMGIDPHKKIHVVDWLREYGRSPGLEFDKVSFAQLVDYVR